MARIAIHPGSAQSPGTRRYDRLSQNSALVPKTLYELRLAEAKAGKAIKKLPTLKRLDGAHA